MVSSGICSGEREEKSGFIICLRHCGRIHHRRASVPLCDEGQVSSEKRDVSDAEKENENTDGRTVYEVLKKEEFPETKLGQLESDFRVDDHSYWPKDEEKKKQSQIENQWQDISERMETEMETFSKEASESSGSLIDQVKVENRERMDYREFLRKFSVLKEEMTVDPDSFDYNFYSYGLSLYGNMPLIEPQEWKEVQKVEEFVIVIDTSMSCSGELVKKFLERHMVC